MWHKNSCIPFAQISHTNFYFPLPEWFRSKLKVWCPFTLYGSIFLKKWHLLTFLNQELIQIHTKHSIISFRVWNVFPSPPLSWPWHFSRVRQAVCFVEWPSVWVYLTFWLDSGHTFLAGMRDLCHPQCTTWSHFCPIRSGDNFDHLPSFSL